MVVTRVGISSFDAVADWYFYPDNGGVVMRLGPRVAIVRAESNAGGRVSQWIAPGFTIRAAGDTTVSFTWYPHADVSTPAGLRTYELFALSISSTPFAWMPQAKLSVVGGETLDVVTGAVCDGWNIAGTCRRGFRNSRSHRPPAIRLRGQPVPMVSNGRSSLTQYASERTWHFSSKLNLRLTHQEATLDAMTPFASLQAPAGLETNSRRSC